jgi:hypothetical protein
VTGKTGRRNMEAMFAPHCSTCGSRRLLGFNRIVASDWDRGGTIYLRCTCGTVIAADAQPSSTGTTDEAPLLSA